MEKEFHAKCHFSFNVASLAEAKEELKNAVDYGVFITDFTLKNYDDKRQCNLCNKDFKENQSIKFYHDMLLCLECYEK